MAIKSVAAVDADGNGKVFKVGQFVAIHPASDWFMRGATHATITSLDLLHARVRLGSIGPKRLRPRIAYDLLTIISN